MWCSWYVPLSFLHSLSLPASRVHQPVLTHLLGLGAVEKTNICALQGMGEPLNNYENVRAAASLMIDPRLFALRKSKVTISTVGIVPRILQVRTNRLTQVIDHI